MATTPPPPPPGALAPASAPRLDLRPFTPEQREEVLRNLSASLAPETRRAYASHWKAWVAWCAANGQVPLPATPGAVAAYLSERGRQLKPSSLGRHRDVIARAHSLAGLPKAQNPARAQEVELVLRGIRRRKVGARPKGKEPLTGAVLAQLLARVPSAGRRGLRDRALLLLGFAGAFRRSELVGVDVEHLGWLPGKGVVVLVPRSKTDQEGAGQMKAIAELPDNRNCPVAALRAWLEAAEIRSGAVFRGLDSYSATCRGRLTGQSVALIIKKYAALARLDARLFGGHSLRAGYVTHGFEAGVDPVRMMAQTGHTGPQMLLRYRRVGNPFTNAAADMLDQKTK